MGGKKDTNSTLIDLQACNNKLCLYCGTLKFIYFNFFLYHFVYVYVLQSLQIIKFTKFDP